jgi:hypothetical protein
MKAKALKALIGKIPDDAEVKFESNLVYIDYCDVEEYPEKYLNGYPPFWYLKPTVEEKKERSEEDGIS